MANGFQENLKAGIVERMGAAEGFIFSADAVRRERYEVVISGVVQIIQHYNTLWTVQTLQIRLKNLNWETNI